MATPDSPELRILVLGPRPVIGAGIAIALERAGHHAHSALDGLDMVGEWDVIVADLGATRGDAERVLRLTQSRFSSGSLVVYAATTERWVRSVLGDANVSTVLRRNTTLEDLVQSVEAAAASLGQTQHDDAVDVFADLTPRERETLRATASIAATDLPAVAAHLGISEHTVRSHLQTIVRKLGLGSRAEAVLLAREVLQLTPVAEPGEEYSSPTIGAATPRVVVLAHSDSVEGVCITAAVDAIQGIDLVAAMTDSPQIVDELEAIGPDLIVLHLDETMSRLASLVPLKERGTGLLGVGDTTSLKSVLSAFESGVDGYVALSEPTDVLAIAVRRVAAGGAHVPERVLGEVLRHLHGRRVSEEAAIRGYAGLSTRERHILSMLSAGHDERSIASSLVISTLTSRTHIQNVTRKLGAGSRSEAAELDRRHRLTERFGERP